MKNFILTAAALCLCLTAYCQDWKLVWSDEFDGASLNLENWTYETGTGVNGDFGTGQKDRATDRPENVAIEQGIAGADGGALRITTRKENFMDREYTSGRINSKGKASWGPNHRIVARVWPQDVRYMGQGFAFWMMPDEVRPGDTNISWPQGGEVDIMEYVGSIPKHNLGSVHYAWDWNNNEYADWNHGHHGGYYSFDEQQVPDNPEWLRVDLGPGQTVNKVVIYWENRGKTITIETSDDGTTWNPVGATVQADGKTDTFTFGARTARFIRMSGTERSNDWGYSIFEFEIYGPSGGANLALNRPTQASSSQADDIADRFAVDGNRDSRWSSGLRNPSYQCCEPSSATDPAVGANGWHDYGIDWYDDRMEFFVDDNVYHIHYFNDGAAFATDGENEKEVQVVNGRRVVKSEFSNLYPEWHPFEHKMFAILSAGVGGGGQTYGGPIVDQAEFPVDVYIDWVRVYSNGQMFNPPPSVSIVKPTGKETYSAPANITLEAEASDRDGGSIQYVSFYDGGQILFYDTEAPYVFEWKNVPAGPHTIRVLVGDNEQATAVATTEIVVNGPGSNLALNRPGTALTETGAFVADNAFDDDPESRWESAQEDPQWIYVDLGNTYDIKRVKILWETAMARDYRVEVSDRPDGGWRTARTVTGNQERENDLGLSELGRYVRIYGTARATNYGYSILNMEVYGIGSSDTGGGGDPVVCGSENIALNRPADASSAEGPFEAAGAFDGRADTRWGSIFRDSEWLRVDLGSSYNVCTVKLLWENPGKDYRIRLGTTPLLSESQVIAVVTDSDGGTDQVDTDASVAGRYLWMQGVTRSNGWGYSLAEMEVYGQASPAAASASRMLTTTPTLNPELTLYPNPVNETLTLRGGAQAGDQVEILSVIGVSLMKQAVTSGNQLIDVSALRPGVYTLRTSGSRSQTMRFIKE